ncbi:tRNA (guanine-N(1)-)-methyltransferase [Candidatus Photodesmus blepharus]|uniref:tRNA (guanine-N(1)-)-methyltransferase n=1 Tax=Candidatus Photodesmus blepharonis TaxID=1179155 RepID=A0A084CP54_9GAMM|nr:tRNA (guanosine(37)-N1)-methyltransferase TrmD [Candidatus Photodesmus blepharus]KEY91583.1 tRNA (guanine-N(1)-)-methyltransferase [Candidatus Photodesmus blepharus]
MWIGVVSLFPEMFLAITNFGITSRAVKNGLLSIKIWNPRNFIDNKRAVDDKPYGGGPGMLMMVQPLRDAISIAKKSSPGKTKTIYLSPQGRKLNQSNVKKLAANKSLLLICGRYKGIDERIIESEIDEEWSIGDFIMTGGEIPAMALIDSVSRFIPGVLGNLKSAEEDSFSNGLLDHPHYTRPEIIDGKKIPMVLKSGNHKEIHCWKTKQSLGRTWLRRPELLKNLPLTNEQESLLTQFIEEHNSNR